MRSWEIIQTAASEGLRVDGASGGFAFVVKGGTTYTSHVRAGLTVEQIISRHRLATGQ